MSDIKFGVLRLENARTYGRQTKKNGKFGKLFFGITPAKCLDVPVKVAYEPLKAYGKCKDICNIKKNRFVSYRIINDCEGERPIANLVENYGPVDDLDALIKYRFAVKNLELRPKLGRSMVNAISDIHHQACMFVRSLNDLEPIPIITIDPVGCKDIDDGVGIISKSDGTYTISICITHLPSYLMSENISQDQLVDSLHNPCSVYLPERTIHMFDETFSLGLFSLSEGKLCPVLCLSVIVNSDGTISDRILDVRLATVVKNYSYDSQELYNDSSYRLLQQITKLCFMKNPVKALDDIYDSHDLIAYLMILMNSYTAEILYELNMGIFRLANPIDNVRIPPELSSLKHIICNRASNYVLSSKISNTPYCHITSPMRRLPDLINMIILTKHLYTSVECSKFDKLIEKSTTNVETIDQMCRSAKKIGEELSLLYDIYYEKIDLSNLYEAVVIEQDQKRSNSYQVYIQDINKWFNVKTTHKLRQYEKVKCRILLFENAHTLIKKVRLCLEK